MSSARSAAPLTAMRTISERWLVSGRFSSFSSGRCRLPHRVADHGCRRTRRGLAQGEVRVRCHGCDPAGDCVACRMPRLAPDHRMPPEPSRRPFAEDARLRWARATIGASLACVTLLKRSHARRPTDRSVTGADRPGQVGSASAWKCRFRNREGAGARPAPSSLSGQRSNRCPFRYRPATARIASASSKRPRRELTGTGTTSGGVPPAIAVDTEHALPAAAQPVSP